VKRAPAAGKQAAQLPESVAEVQNCLVMAAQMQPVH